jgi:phage anti-repressor protein
VLAVKPKTKQSKDLEENQIYIIKGDLLYWLVEYGTGSQKWLTHDRKKQEFNSCSVHKADCQHEYA